MSWFKLVRPMDEYTNVDPGDIVNAKQALRQLGYYQPPIGNQIGAWVDNNLFDGVRKFQRDNRLKVDGVMKPGGPTEKTINQRLGFVSKAQDNGDDQNKDPSVIVPPAGDPNMPILDQPFPPRSAPVLDQNGNPVIEGRNPWTGIPIFPPRGPY